MAIDQVTESVQRQERPIFSLKLFKALSIAAVAVSVSDENELCAAAVLKENPVVGLTSSKSLMTALPPLKSPRYCKKQRIRQTKSRALSSHLMLMHETSINHHRVASALNELGGLHDEHQQLATIDKIGFWSKKHCQDFWNEYQKCEIEQFSVPLTRQFSTLSFKDDVEDSDDWSGHSRYIKISRSIRALLKRTFTGAPTFCELERLIQGILSNPLDCELSCGQVLKISEFGATIKLDTPFHRVWLHAICQYYGLTSQSKTVCDDRLVFINFAKFSLSSSTPKITLYNYLLNL